MLIVLCILKFSSYDQIQSYPCFRNSRMQGDNHSELAQYALENLFHKLEKDRETKRIRAVKYRQKKKQQEQQRATRLHMLTSQNVTLWNEIQELKRENKQLSADLAKHKTHCQQLSARLAIYQSHCRMEGSEYRVYTGSNEFWNTSKRETDEEQIVINDEPNSGALMMIQEDDQTASDGDMTNNQEMNSDEASMHNEEWTYYLGNIF